MLYKTLLCILLAGMLCLSAGCDTSEDDGWGGEDATEGTKMPDPETYEDHYAIFMNEGLDVTVTLTVDMVPSVENRFSLKEEQGTTVVTDLTAGRKESYDEEDAEQARKSAGYLPPYKTAYDNGDGTYGVRFGGDLALEMLLSGSNLFDGYSSGNVTLDGECTYSASVDYGIESYSYDFAVNISDGDATFPAKVKYLIEVNE